MNTEHRETGQTKGQGQVIEHDTSAACCQERKKIISEGKDSEEETMEQLEELDAVPKINVSQELLEAINKLIRLFSFAEVEQALKLAQR